MAPTWQISADGRTLTVRVIEHTATVAGRDALDLLLCQGSFSWIVLVNVPSG